jgi:hypothetical protein
VNRYLAVAQFHALDDFAQSAALLFRRLRRQHHLYVPFHVEAGLLDGLQFRKAGFHGAALDENRLQVVAESRPCFLQFGVLHRLARAELAHLQFLDVAGERRAFLRLLLIGLLPLCQLAVREFPRPVRIRELVEHVIPHRVFDGGDAHRWLLTSPRVVGAVLIVAAIARFAVIRKDDAREGVADAALNKAAQEVGRRPAAIDVPVPRHPFRDALKQRPVDDGGHLHHNPL